MSVLNGAPIRITPRPKSVALSDTLHCKQQVAIATLPPSLAFVAHLMDGLIPRNPCPFSHLSNCAERALR